MPAKKTTYGCTAPYRTHNIQYFCTLLQMSSRKVGHQFHFQLLCVALLRSHHMSRIWCAIWCPQFPAAHSPYFHFFFSLFFLASRLYSVRSVCSIFPCFFSVVSLSRVSFSEGVRLFTSGTSVLWKMTAAKVTMVRSIGDRLMYDNLQAEDTDTLLRITISTVRLNARART